MPRVYMKTRQEQHNSTQLLLNDQPDLTFNSNSHNTSSQRNILRSVNTLSNLRYDQGQIKFHELKQNTSSNTQPQGGSQVKNNASKQIFE